jgi:hypothetical protein
VLAAVEVPALANVIPAQAGTDNPSER